MFTGLVEAVGHVIALEKAGDQARLVVALPFGKELTSGESVAINGCCLTVTEWDENSAAFDLLAQTLAVTSLGNLSVGSAVNLERAMQAGARFGGHFVQGHVDATGRIIEIAEVGQDHVITVSLPPSIRRLCVDKGSFAIDGISLTIAELRDDAAFFWITPHTWAHTHLVSAIVGQPVNLEADMLAKHVDALLTARLPLS
ncbi:MAG: riboflavin synthase [Verrucomicrobiota bacterium]